LTEAYPTGKNRLIVHRKEADMRWQMIRAHIWATLLVGGEPLRAVINFCITVIALFLLRLFGWITLHPAASTHALGDTLLILAVMALALTLSQLLVSVLFPSGCLFLPISAIWGFVFLQLAAHYTPMYVSISPNFWLALLSGLLLGIRFPRFWYREWSEWDHNRGDSYDQ
jgi:hypothetical protein